MPARILDLPPGTPSPPDVLSKTTAALLVEKSPRHAHLKKSGRLPSKATDAMDMGTIVHAILLGKSTRPIVVVTKDDGQPFDDWRTKAAKEAKANALAAGHLPILKKTADFAMRAAERFRERMIELGYRLNGESELAIEWTEPSQSGPVTCWGALDHWHAKDRTIFDLKVGEDAHPETCGRQVRNLGGLIQAAAYTSAIEQLHPDLQGRTRFVFLFCELGSGEVVPVTLGGDIRRLGEMQWRRAVEAWGYGLASGDWPGYSDGPPIVLEAKPWEMDREMAEQHDAAERDVRRPSTDDDSDDMPESFNTGDPDR